MKSGRTSVLPIELENLLVNYCIQINERLFGLRVNVVELLAIRENVRHPFNSSL